MNYANTVAQNDMTFSYHPMPFFNDVLVVLEKQDEFHIYEFAGVSGNEFVFMALDSKVENIKTTQWTNLPLVGTVTNTIHQMKPRRDLMKFAA